MDKALVSRNVQAVVKGTVHKQLRDIAYSKGKPLKDLLGEILTDYASKNAGMQQKVA